MITRINDIKIEFSRFGTISYHTSNAVSIPIDFLPRIDKISKNHFDHSFRLENMFMISLTVCASLLFAISSAIPYPGNDVFSAVIHNKQNIPVRCSIIWEGLDGLFPDATSFIIPSQGAQTVDERVYEKETAYYRAHIKQIQCGDSTLRYPFEGVRGMNFLWNFDVESTGLVSAGPKEE